MNTIDYYEILGVSPTATNDEIKKSYRRLAMEHHPDSCGSLQYNETFYQIQEAYKFLSNQERRRLYDEQRNQEDNANPWDKEDPFKTNYISKEDVNKKLLKENKQNISQIQNILQRHSTSQTMKVELSGIRFQSSKKPKMANKKFLQKILTSLK